MLRTSMDLLLWGSIEQIIFKVFYKSIKVLALFGVQ